MRKEYKKLELDKILALLSEHAVSDACREKISNIRPEYDIDTVRAEIKKRRRLYIIVKVRHAEVF